MLRTYNPSMIRKAIIGGMTIGVVICMLAHFVSFHYDFGYKRGRVLVHATYGSLVLEVSDQFLAHRSGSFAMRRFDVTRFIPWFYPARFGMTTVVLPFWTMVALLSAYPTIAFVCPPLRRRHRRRKGLCLECGYNLRGLPEPRCPECGTEIDPSTLPSTPD